METSVQATLPPKAVATAAYNPLLPGFKEDPHPFFHRLRSEDPVHWSPVFQIWVLTRYADVLSSLREERLSANGRNWENYEKYFMRNGGPPPSSAQVYRHWMLQLDPPDHTRLRALVSKAFTPRVVEAMRTRIQQVTEDLLDRVQGRNTMDVVKDLAYPLPIIVIADMLGAPPSDYERIKKWSTDLLPSFSPALSKEQLAQVSESASEFAAYVQNLIEERRRKPGDELIDGLIAARDGANRLTDAELVSTCVLLVVAGHLTTVQLVGRGFLLLLKNPAQMEKLRREPEFIGSAIEEMLRMEAPLQVVNRPALADFQIDGKTIRKGQLVLLSLAAANRDPAQFPDPDRFDIARAPNRHLGFGYGLHFCPGAPLARLEAEIAINTLLRRQPTIEPTDVKLEYEPSLILRGLNSLPVRLTEGGM
jgi:pimeloyl-[acyl-carrier protein] synthase